MKPTSPIKRDKSLIVLSKDHHDGLLLVWKVRQGIRYEVSSSRIGQYVVKEFSSDLEPHFIEEENLLFNKLEKEDVLRQQAEDEHAAIRKAVAALHSSATSEALQEFAQLLEAHIRFEERILFPHIEKKLSREQLDDIGRQLQNDYQAGKKPSDWHDEFWIKK